MASQKKTVLLQLSPEQKQQLFSNGRSSKPIPLSEIQSQIYPLHTLIHCAQIAEGKANYEQSNYLASYQTKAIPQSIVVLSTSNKSIHYVSKAAQKSLDIASQVAKSNHQKVPVVWERQKENYRTSWKMVEKGAKQVKDASFTLELSPCPIGEALRHEEERIQPECDEDDEDEEEDDDDDRDLLLEQARELFQ